MLARDNLIEIMKIQSELFPKNKTDIAINIMKQINKFYKISIESNKTTTLSKTNENDVSMGSITLEKTCLLGCVDSYVMFYINYINKNKEGMLNCILYCRTNMSVLNLKNFSQFEKHCILIANYICSLIINEFGDFFRNVVTMLSNKNIIDRELSIHGLTEFYKITNKYKEFSKTQKRYDVSEIMKAALDPEYEIRLSKNLFQLLDNFLEKHSLTQIFNFVQQLDINVDISSDKVVSFQNKNYRGYCENYLEMTDIINYPYFQKSFFENFENNLIIKKFSEQDQNNIMVSLYIKEQVPKNKEILSRIGPQLFEILLLNSEIALKLKKLACVNKYYNSFISEICVELPEDKIIRCGGGCKYKIFLKKETVLYSRPKCAMCLNLTVCNNVTSKNEIFDVWCKCSNYSCNNLFFHTKTDYLSGNSTYIGGKLRCKKC